MIAYEMEIDGIHTREFGYYRANRSIKKVQGNVIQGIINI